MQYSTNEALPSFDSAFEICDEQPAADNLEMLSLMAMVACAMLGKEPFLTLVKPAISRSNSRR